MNLNISISEKQGGAMRVIQIDTSTPAADAVGSLVELRADPQPPRLEWSHTLTDKCVDYVTAEKACAALGEGWRLPTRQELESILDLSRHKPAADTERFPDMKSDWYWSSTPCAWSSVHAWCVDFGCGLVYYLHRGNHDAFVRAVRAVPAGQ
jgi:hypothetical protein